MEKNKGGRGHKNEVPTTAVRVLTPMIPLIEEAEQVYQSTKVIPSIQRDNTTVNKPVQVSKAKEIKEITAALATMRMNEVMQVLKRQGITLVETEAITKLNGKYGMNWRTSNRIIHLLALKVLDAYADGSNQTKFVIQVPESPPKEDQPSTFELRSRYTRDKLLV